MTQFKPIAGLEGRYSVSDAGQVRNDRTGRILKTRIGDSGYEDLQLGRIDGRRPTRRVHVLVAEAFLPAKPSPKHEPNHIDGDKSNNAAINLEWLTRGQNAKHAWAMGLKTAETHARGTKHPNARLTDDQVRQIYASPLGPRELGRRYGVYHSTIRFIKSGRTWSEVTGHPKG